MGVLATDGQSTTEKETLLTAKEFLKQNQGNACWLSRTIAKFQVQRTTLIEFLEMIKFTEA